MADFGPDKVFCPNFQISEFSYFNDTHKRCKNEEILRDKGVMSWMIWYGIAQMFLFYHVILMRWRH